MKRKMTTLVVGAMLAITGVMPASATVDIHEDPSNAGPPVTEGGDVSPEILDDDTEYQPKYDNEGITVPKRENCTLRLKRLVGKGFSDTYFPSPAKDANCQNWLLALNSKHNHQ